MYIFKPLIDITYKDTNSLDITQCYHIIYATVSQNIPIQIPNHPTLSSLLLEFRIKLDATF